VYCNNCYGANEERNYYCVEGNEKNVTSKYDRGITLQYFTVSPPLSYGNYSIPGFEACGYYPTTALPLKSGKEYIIKVHASYQYDHDAYGGGWSKFGWDAKLAIEVK
jgi:hypothetical protein